MTAVSAFYVGLRRALMIRGECGNRKRPECLRGAAVWNNLGVLQLRQKDSEKAAASFEKASGLAPENAQIAFNQAILALNGWRRNSAIKLTRVRDAP